MDDRADAFSSRWFEETFRAHASAIVRYFARRGPRQDADDLAAEVFAIAWRRRDDVPRGAELPWLYRTAGYVLANHRRKHRDVPVDDLPDHPSGAPGGGDPALAVVTDAELRGALASVSERDRAILLLHAWEGLSGAELADVLGISRSGADAALSRARKRLREAWPDRMAV
ncbi:RNA polymerase, sigma-24 subunit, ECF subfamily [Beutenbergia cavernae DSM 12333]|uniref:RNA polymerase, sigma-24 subunit, ECF subfamily n=1 Tax=Beutenbergia cavernae (strain ATCC BAA-8 / DSM 12333 / CCUG 43141 / JCM 11478 / NBRC 16432 / NCIMB 13614 / HKI 0122) TaxID=471853 RepID=C5BYI4_BEUC1|nr:sigma-70 family RNA polymerase sigma factor [Beutenbergia cavernae]ACQ78942.1 RNA polymerase, sigma-24 subunit, ECF subfamily [Beutenbergia cavernae DSM 12333]